MSMRPPRPAHQLNAQKVNRATLRRAWQFAGPYRGLLVGYLAMTILTTVLGVLPPFIFRQFLDSAIPKRNLGQVNLLAMAMVAIAVIGLVLSLFARLQGARLGEGLIRDIRIALYDHVQKMPIAFFTRTQTGALMSRLNNDVIGAQQAFTYVLRTVLTDVLTVVITMVAMIKLSWQITVLSLAIVPALIFVSRRVGKLQQAAAREAMDLNASMNSVMTERFNVAGALLVMLFGQPKEESRQFSESASRVAAIGVKRAMTGMVLMLGLPLVGSVGVAAVYWWGARQVLDGALTIGTVVAMASFVQRLYGPLTDLASARVDFVTAFVSFDRIFEVLDATPGIADLPGATELPRSVMGGRIEFDNVGFTYPDEVIVASLEAGRPAAAASTGRPSQPVLRTVSFVAEPGTLTAIVGPSGAGKTTITSLLPRLYDVSSGAIRLDGRDVRSLTLDSLRASIGVVSQDSHLFHASIAENLRYARPGASLEELTAAAQGARIHDMIAGLPEGYDTMVGERGYRLSGGEKQRLAIARVLLKDPLFVILDEATAHLDSETELLVQEALGEALQGRTTIAIAHRLATVQAADQILVVDEGRIVERGRHQELIALGGLYAALTEAQDLRVGAGSL